MEHGSQIHGSLEAHLPVCFHFLLWNVHLQLHRRFLMEHQVVMYPEGTRSVSLEAAGEGWTRFKYQVKINLKSGDAGCGAIFFGCIGGSKTF